MGDRTPTGSGAASFPRTPSEGIIQQKNDNEKIHTVEKTWERSQSEVNLDNRAFYTGEINRSASLDKDNDIESLGNRVSEHSKVYWDLSKATDDQPPFNKQQVIFEEMMNIGGNRQTLG
ncbi:uncharacterized protein LOC141898329 [Tubulanus polymorphus]|uniref:uncharacterized protein LOC141898329 n=1 Tax=Tubulanus polymorphus TaxID=672921 RepID=UPI003DA6B2EC